MERIVKLGDGMGWDRIGNEWKREMTIRIQK
jgi:hypothetical protein